MTVPVFLYGSETWVPTKKIKNQIQTSEMKFLRRTKGCTRQQCLRNEDITEELQVFSTNDKIQAHCVEWLKHLDRIENGRLPYVAFRYRPFGTRDIGRPVSYTHLSPSRSRSSYIDSTKGFIFKRNLRQSSILHSVQML